ncbi:MAG: MFS transporter, partial [Thermoplasmata archaeon]|nr:MFS transporter [Thermoplasmata archaeon]
MSSLAVTWLVYHATGSTIDVAYVGLTSFAPGLVIGLAAGVIADRYDRRRLMVAADLVRMGLMALLALALSLFGFSLFLVLAVMTLVFSFTAVFTPASQAILPKLVPVERLEDANGLLAVATQTTT